MIYFFSFFVLLIGLIIGSFLNCFVWRVHMEEGAWNRSYCPKCRKRIAWYDNIPLLSFLILGGKCRNCRRSISIQYPLVELATALLFILAFFHQLPEYSQLDGFHIIGDASFVLPLVRNWFIVFVCLAIFVYDWRWSLIPDIIILPAIAVVAALNLLSGGRLPDLIWPALIGGGFFAFQFLVSRGKWIGGGDIRFGVFMGAALADIRLLILAMLLAYWTGALAGVGLIMSGKKKLSSRVPLGIFLSLGVILALFFGKTIMDRYFGLL